MTVYNPDGVSGGVKKMMVNGVEWDNTFISADYLLGKKNIDVEVILG